MPDANIIARKRGWRDYLELCKPRVVALMLLTSFVGMQLASPGFVPWKALIFGNLGIALSAGCAAVFNHLLDQRIDALMWRTKRRPIPTGKIKTSSAVLFALVLGCAGMLMLVLLVNPLTAVLTFITLVGYAGVYTLFLKRATPQNIVIGGLAGAAPPLLGWVAVTGSIAPAALLLVLIIFIWTPPHFWALAIYRYDDYVKAEIPMLPVTHGIAFTKTNILLYSFLLLAVSILPYVIASSGLFYLISAIVLGVIFLYYAFRLKRSENPLNAMKLFRYSIVYLMLLFLALLIDHFILNFVV